MAQKTVHVTVNGNTITAVTTVSAGPPAIPYDASAATATCTPIKPPGPAIGPKTINLPFVPPTSTITFPNLANGVYTVTVKCSDQSFSQTVMVGPPQPASFSFTHDSAQPEHWPPEGS
jgi:hypothetical protein